MVTLDELSLRIKSIFSSSWTRRNGRVVPEYDELQLTNDAVAIEGAVLYADIKGSTNLVNEYTDNFAAKIYKAFLASVSTVINNNGGVITSFDGDRVMGVFIGDSKCSNSAKSGLQMFSAVRKLNAMLRESYPTCGYTLDYACGIDVSNIFIVRTGVRGANDLAWIGNAANIAAKLSEIRGQTGKTYITERLFDRLNVSSKYSSADKTRCMWSPIAMNILGQQVYQSEWYWDF